MKNYYEILGITEDASIDEIEAAYAFKISSYNATDMHLYEQEIMIIIRAYSTLIDSKTREEYDLKLLKENVISLYGTDYIDITGPIGDAVEANAYLEETNEQIQPSNSSDKNQEDISEYMQKVKEYSYQMELLRQASKLVEDTSRANIGREVYAKQMNYSF